MDFRVKDTPHRVFYWRLPNGAAFDSTTFVSSIERVVGQAIDLFGGAAYSDYTFMYQDGAYGGLEHPNSVTLGAPSAALARDPLASLMETAHEFFHTWNLMRIKPIEYRGVDYRTQPPVSGLWFSEGLTMFYADLLVRRAGLPAEEPTRIAHLESLIGQYLSSAGNSRFSAEQVSRVAYNAGPGALGDYTASTHTQGEIIGALLDLEIRAATNGARSIDDVMRLLNTRFATRGFTSNDIEQTITEVCGCSVRETFNGKVRNANPTPIHFNRYLRPFGLQASISWVPATGEQWPADARSPYLGLPGGQRADASARRLPIPNSVWGRAGLHSRDRLISIKGTTVRNWPELRNVLVRLAIGDTVDFVVERDTGRFQTQVVVRGFDRPQIQIDTMPAASARQRALRDAWLNAR